MLDIEPMTAPAISLMLLSIYETKVNVDNTNHKHNIHDRIDSTGRVASASTTADAMTKQKQQTGRAAFTRGSPTLTKSNTAPVVSLSSSILAKGAFTFNIGSNANTLAISTPTPAPVEPLTIDREGYERSLRGVNQGFLKRIQRDLEHNATANLAGAFEAYIEHRKKVKKQYPGIEEPQTIVLPPSQGCDTSNYNRDYAICLLDMANDMELTIYHMKLV
jgi:hypothetical protein